MPIAFHFVDGNNPPLLPLRVVPLWPSLLCLVFSLQWIVKGKMVVWIFLQQHIILFCIFLLFKFWILICEHTILIWDIMLLGFDLSWLSTHGVCRILFWVWKVCTCIMIVVFNILILVGLCVNVTNCKFWLFGLGLFWGEVRKFKFVFFKRRFSSVRLA